MLRADAEDNRQLVLDAARILFSERGLDVPMRAIARQAGVGPATLYRRFPTKQHLIDAAFADELHACRTIVDEACADTDPWRGFCSYLVRIGELNAQNQGFTDAFLSTFPNTVDFTAHRAAMLHSLADLCRRAQVAGALRPDVVLDDLVLMLMAGRGISAATTAQRLAAARRFSALAIEAFRASGPGVRLPAPARVAAAMLAYPTAATGRGVRASPAA
jgi:AcrR family transcriptional regulator